MRPELEKFLPQKKNEKLFTNVGALTLEVVKVFQRFTPLRQDSALQRPRRSLGPVSSDGAWSNVSSDTRPTLLLPGFPPWSWPKHGHQRAFALA